MSTISFGRTDREMQAITAASTALATGTALKNGVNIVTTAVGETAVVLPQNCGSWLLVRVTSATAGLVFPPTALGTINGGSAGASFSVAQNKPTLFLCHPNGIDYTAVLSA